MNGISSLIQAALVLNVLPKLQAAKVISRLEPEDVKSVMDAIARLDEESASELGLAVDRLASEKQAWQRVEENPESLIKTRQEVESILKRNSPRLDAGAIDQPFDFLADTIPVIRCHILQDEHPRNIAIVLSLLPPNVSSETMKTFDDTSLRVSVLKRMCELDEVSDEEIAQLRFALSQRLNKLLRARDAEEGSVSNVVQMLSCADSGMRETLLAHFNQVDPDLAAKLKRSVFEIDRLRELKRSDLRVVLQNVDTSCWAPALKQAPVELLETVYAGMASPAVELLQREIDELGRVDPALQELSRQNIVTTVMQLARDGKIDLRQNDRIAPEIELGAD